MWREWRGENPMGYVVGAMLTLATHWQSGSSVAQWLPTLENSLLLKSQFCKGCGGSGGVRIEWGMW